MQGSEWESVPGGCERAGELPVRIPVWMEVRMEMRKRVVSCEEWRAFHLFDWRRRGHQAVLQRANMLSSAGVKGEGEWGCARGVALGVWIEARIRRGGLSGV